MSELTFKQYQEQAIDTKAYPPELAIPYCTIGLSGETGEVSEKVKKVIRDKKGVFSDNDKQEISKELGDCLWYLAALADEIGFDLQRIAIENLDKLQSRKQRGVLRGSGDNR